MKKTLAIAAMLCCMGVAMAGPVGPERAAAVAHTFWTQTLHGKADALLVDRSVEWPFVGIYLFVNPQGGFVMVAADDAVRPILGYSPDGKIEPRNLPIQLQEWLEVYQQQIDWVRENDGQSYAADREAWGLLDSGQGLKDGDNSVGPLLTTQWDQDAPYNMLCPPGTVTGCAATAQAQFMKFWNHPAVGYGSHSYTHSQYGVQSADFGNTFYDWGNMPNKTTNGSTYNERLAVATLMYHCGVSLEMGYGTAAQGGSAAMGLAGMPGYPSIDNSLKDYFGYSRDMEVKFKNMPLMGQEYTNEQWRAMLVAELDLSHPILYAGSAEQGGHGFVCDGYDSRQYMHFNFGWSGVGDGYYPVDSISPGVGGAGGNVTYTFNMNNAALFGAVPVYELRTNTNILFFPAEGGTDSLILCVNVDVNEPWQVVSDADWVTVDSTEISNAGWVRVNAATFEGMANERVATLTFIQGTESVEVRVLQVNYNESEFCPVTVVMEATRGDGWQDGARLTLQSEGGYVFGTATLTQGTLDSVTIAVAPHGIYAVWHSGGGTDRYINYRMKNQYGETLLNVVNAYYNGDTNLIEWPCAHLGIEDLPLSSETYRIYPNPVADVLHIDGLPDGGRVELYDLAGRRVMTGGATLNTQELAAGSYLLRIITDDGVRTEKVTKR